MATSQSFSFSDPFIRQQASLSDINPSSGRFLHTSWFCPSAFGTVLVLLSGDPIPLSADLMLHIRDVGLSFHQTLSIFYVVAVEDTLLLTQGANFSV